MPTISALANEIAQRFPDRAVFVYMHILSSPNTAKSQQLASARLEAMFSRPDWQQLAAHVISQPAQLPSTSTSAFSSASTRNRPRLARDEEQPCSNAEPRSASWSLVMLRSLDHLSGTAVREGSVLSHIRYRFLASLGPCLDSS